MPVARDETDEPVDREQNLRVTPKQRRSAGSIDEILDAAVRLATRTGLDQLTTVLVAKEADVSVGKVYYWFKDKRALIDAARTRGHEEFSAFLRDTLQDLGVQDSSVMLPLYVRAFSEYMVAHPEALDLLDGRSSGTGASISPFRAQMMELIEAILLARIDGIGKPEAALVSQTIVTMVIALTRDLVNAPEESRSTLVSELVYLVAAYLHARYPHADDPTWDDPRYPIQPVRPGAPERSEPLYPASP